MARSPPTTSESRSRSSRPFRRTARSTDSYRATKYLPAMRTISLSTCSPRRPAMHKIASPPTISCSSTPTAGQHQPLALSPRLEFPSSALILLLDQVLRPAWSLRPTNCSRPLTAMCSPSIATIEFQRRSTSPERMSASIRLLSKLALRLRWRARTCHPTVTQIFGARRSPKL